ncbi:MAG: hypothetical protein ACI92G_000437 [Candidatus Pelagisphaera sp.]|jgi:hypothetical protein
MISLGFRFTAIESGSFRETHASEKIDDRAETSDGGLDHIKSCENGQPNPIGVNPMAESQAG